MQDSQSRNESMMSMNKWHGHALGKGHEKIYTLLFMCHLLLVIRLKQPFEAKSLTVFNLLVDRTSSPNSR